MDLKIPSRALGCLTEEIYHAHAKGEISDKEYFVSYGVWVSENLFKYPLQLCPPMTDGVRSYIRGRLAGQTDYQPPMTSKMIGWANACVKAELDNRSDYEMFRFYTEKLLEVGMQDAIRRLQDRMEMYARAEIPNQSLEDVKRVGELDAIIRQSQAKGRASA